MYISLIKGDTVLTIKLFTNFAALLTLNKEMKTFLKNAPAIEAAKTEGNLEKEREIIRKSTNTWATNVAAAIKVEYEVLGKENLPSKGPVLIVANHQGYGDILGLLYAIDTIQFGFVAKSEFEKWSFFRKGIKYSEGLFLIRGNGRETVKALHIATDKLKQGYSFAIFPEGTRSQGGAMAPFKAGTFKFAEKANVPILPVTINGSYKIYEENKVVTPCKQNIIIHPLVHYEKLNRDERKEARTQIEDTIRAGLDINRK